MFKGEFVTAYLQREIPENAIVADDLQLGELVKVTPAVGNVPAIVNKLVAETEDEALSEATHFIAQSDMTLEYGHVPVENRNYAYEKDVATMLDLTKLGTVYYGIFTSTSDLPDDDIAEGDTAMVYDSNDGSLHKYEVAESGSTLAWTKSTTGAYSVTLESVTKKVALYKITNKLDIIVKDAG